MNKDKEITRVIFRIDSDGVFALFPYEVVVRSGITFHKYVMCYAHIGQHSSANYNYCIRKSKAASIDEAKDLKKELEDIGYNLKEVKRRYRKHMEV